MMGMNQMLLMRCAMIYECKNVMSMIPTQGVITHLFFILVPLEVSIIFCSNNLPHGNSESTPLEPWDIKFVPPTATSAE